MAYIVPAKSIAVETLVLPRFEGTRRRPGMTTAVMLLSDALGLMLAWAIVLLLGTATGLQVPADFSLRALILLPVTIMVLAAGGLYPALGLDVLPEAQRIITSISFVQIGSISSFVPIRTTGDAARFLGLWALSMAAIILGRWFLRALAAKRSWWGESAFLIGTGRALEETFNLLANHPRLGLHPIALLSEPYGVPACASGLPVFYDLKAGSTFAHRENIRKAIVALSSTTDASTLTATERYRLSFQKLIIIPPKSDRFSLCSHTGTIGGSLCLEVSHKLLVPFSLTLKRLMDLLIAVPAAMVLLPVMVLTAVAIKLTSPGPIFFGHSRLGRRQVPFLAWKFRTMVSDADTLLAERLATDPDLRAEWERDHKLRKDPRLTPIGAVLRRYSLDELPQIWNVFRGEMSIVGPRPICEAEVARYGKYIADYSRVLPGLTGLWQVSGRNETTYQKRVELDTFYVNNWSPSLDLYIIARTFRAVFSARGAY